MTITETTGTFPYIECAIGGSNQRNDVRRAEDHSSNGYADCFRSMLRFPETFRAYVEYKGSVKDYDGESKADFFPADFDHAPDFAKALEDARSTVRRWEAVYGVPAEALRYSFSGHKGVHIEIPEVLFGGLEPGRDTASRLKAVAGELLKDAATADTGIYNTTRLWREPATKHRKSGLYKTPLYSHEFFNLTPDEIRSLAREKREQFVATDAGEFEPVPELVRLWERARGVISDELRRERLDTAEILAGVSEGERDTKLFKLACKLRGADVPQDMAERILVEAAGKCDPPFPPRDALQKVENAYHAYEPNNVGGRLLSSSSGPLGDLSDDDNNEVVWFSELGEPKRREFLLEEVCVKGYPFVAFGAGGVAKSFAMLLAGIAIAGGRHEWFGLRVLDHGCVLYADFELDQDEQHRRVRDLCAGLGIPIPKNLAYLSGVGLTAEQAFSQIIAFCREYEAKAVVIDSMGLAMNGDMEHAKDVLNFHAKYINPIRRVGTTPLIVDHEGKRQAGEKHRDKSPFGSAYKAWTARSVLQFELDNYDRENGALDVRVRQTKTNFGPKIEPFGVRFTFECEKVSTETYVLADAELAEEESVPARDRIVGALGPAPATRRELEQLTGLSGGTIRNNLSDLMKDGIVGEDGYQGRSKVYCLLSSSPQNPKGDGSDDNKRPAGENDGQRPLQDTTRPVPASFRAKPGESATVADYKADKLAEFFEDPPAWFRKQAASCAEQGSPERLVKPLVCSASYELFGTADRHQEVRPAVEAWLEELA